MDLLLEQVCAGCAVGLFHFSRCRLWKPSSEFHDGTIYSTGGLVFWFSVRVPMDSAGSTKALSGLPARALASRSGWPGIAQLPGMERHGAHLCRRSRIAAYT